MKVRTDPEIGGKMMTKGRIIRYVLEIGILGGLITAYFLVFQPREPVEYPGHWIQTPGPEGIATRCMFWDSKSDRILSGSRISADGGGLGIYQIRNMNWVYPKTNLKKDQTVVDIAPVGGNLWALCFSNAEIPGGILVSSNIGRTWEGEIGIPDGVDPRCLVVFGDGVLLGTVSHGVLRSRDEGATWAESNRGLANLKIQSLCLDPHQKQKILAGTLSGIYSSGDGGLTWKLSSAGLPEDNALVVGIHADRFNRDRFYAIVRNNRGQGFIFRSKNGGRSWRTCMRGLPEGVQPRSMEFYPRQPGVIFAGTVHDGVYRSDDGGGFWSPMNKGLPLDKNFIIVHCLKFGLSVREVLFAGTDLNGTVWEYRFE